MMETLHIAGFKSIKDLEVPCRRVNLLLGPPNSGKSNILEALGLLSFLHYARRGRGIRDFIRLESVSNLFPDDDLGTVVNISADDILFSLRYANGRYEGVARRGEADLVRIAGDHRQLSVQSSQDDAAFRQFKFYRCESKGTFPGAESDYLMPPDGDNLLSVLLRNKDLRAAAGQPFTSIGLRLVLRVQENKIEVQKSADDVIISYPYILSSETLRRVVFYLTAIMSNQRSVVVFEEPEAHAFPYYTKYLAEQVALDDNGNQYFISTHNPYFLLPLLEKCPADEVAVHVIRFDNYETTARRLTSEELTQMDEIDVFSNLDRYTADS